MFNSINKSSPGGERSILTNDTKRVVDFLSRTLQFGQRIQDEKSRSDEEKKRTLDELRCSVQKSMKRHEQLQSEQGEICSEISDLKIRIQNERDEFVEKLCTLERTSDSLSKAKISNQKLNLIKELQNHFLHRITNLILVLRDCDVRPCRDHLGDDLMNIDLNGTLDETLKEIDKQINDLIADVSSTVSQLDRKKEIDFAIFSDQANNCEDDESSKRFLLSMESSGFDYDRFNF